MHETVKPWRHASMVDAFRSLSREMQLAGVARDQIKVVLKDDAFFDLKNYMMMVLPSHEAAEIVNADYLQFNGIKVIRGT